MDRVLIIRYFKSNTEAAIQQVIEIEKGK